MIKNGDTALGSLHRLNSGLVDYDTTEVLHFRVYGLICCPFTWLAQSCHTREPQYHPGSFQIDADKLLSLSLPPPFERNVVSLDVAGNESGKNLFLSVTHTQQNQVYKTSIKYIKIIKEISTIISTTVLSVNQRLKQQQPPTTALPRAKWISSGVSGPCCANRCNCYSSKAWLGGQCCRQEGYGGGWGDVMWCELELLHSDSKSQPNSLRLFVGGFVTHFSFIRNFTLLTPSTVETAESEIK